MSRGNRLMLRRPNLNKVAKIKTSSSKNQKSSKMDPQIWHKIAAISGKLLLFYSYKKMIFWV
uniref:Uncharacterized protein n=1 Tax=Solanum tuberosum TaxID=4113 RepID=M1A6E1_SOLTU